jgi:hypothetical protein
MKNQIAFFVLLSSLCLSGFVLARGHLEPAPSGATLAAVATPAAQIWPAAVSASVRILHTWIEQKGGVEVLYLDHSLGTAVAPSVILTHNHYLRPERPESDAYIFTTSTGQAFTVPASELTVRALNAGVQMIYLPGGVTLTSASLGNQAAIDRLAEGEWLTVDYWDEARERFAQGNFQIERVEKGAATLSDPQRVVRPGDSGGGIYVAGRLIGDTWARYVDTVSGQPTGAFDVALLSPEAIRLLQPKRARLAPDWPLEPPRLGPGDGSH